jgi:S1-C subfamily serine protease
MVPMTVAILTLIAGVISADATPETRPSIGLVVTDFSPRYAIKAGCPVRNGVLVRGLLADRPAVLAGFKKADVITRIDDVSTPDLDTFNEWAENAQAERTYKVTVYRQRETGVWWRLKLLLRPLRRR